MNLKRTMRLALPAAMVLTVGLTASPTRAATNLVFEHTITTEPEFVFECSGEFTGVGSYLEIKDPDTADFAAGDTVDFSFTLDPPLIVTSATEFVFLHLRLDPSTSDTGGGARYDSGVINVAGQNLQSSFTARALVSAGGIPEAFAVGLYAEIPGATWFTDPSQDGLIESVTGSLTVPDDVPGRETGEIGGHGEANFELYATSPCPETGDPEPLLVPLHADVDGDGVNDDADNCPSVANATQQNTDGDDLGDACDPDDDNDGQTDDDELECGSSPIDSTDLSPDADGDGVPDCLDPDDDNDSVVDSADLCGGTTLPDVVTKRLKKRRFIADEAGVFGTSGYTIADTGGCSAAQIITADELGKRHTKFGLSKRALKRWVWSVEDGCVETTVNPRDHGVVQPRHVTC